MANAYRDPKKKRQPFKVEDFMPKKQTVKQQSPEDLMAMMRAWNAALGGTEVING